MVRDPVFRATGISHMCRDKGMAAHRLCIERGCVCWCHYIVAAWRPAERGWKAMEEIEWTQIDNP